MIRIFAAALAALLSGTGAASNAPQDDAHDASHEQALGAQPAAQAHAKDVHPGPDAPATDVPATVVPFATDAPLREAMSRVLRASLAAASGDPATSAALVRTVDESIAHMVANCKLEPAADAVLHGFIGRMASAAAALRRRPGDNDSLTEIRTMMRDYASAFDHPEFTVPAN